LQDCIQEGLIAAWEAEKTYQPNKGANMNTYITTCVIRRYQTILRSTHRQRKFGIMVNPEILENLRCPVDHIQDFEVTLDLAMVRSNLSTNAQRLLDYLMQPELPPPPLTHKTMRDALGMSVYVFRNALSEARSTVYEHYRSL